MKKNCIIFFPILFLIQTLHFAAAAEYSAQLALQRKVSTTTDSANDPNSPIWEDKEMVVKLFTLDSTTKAKANSEFSLIQAFNLAKTTNKVMPFTGVGFWMIIESVEGVSKDFFIVFFDKKNKLVRISPAAKVGSDVFIQKNTFITTDNGLIIDLAAKLGSPLDPAK